MGGTRSRSKAARLGTLAALVCLALILAAQVGAAIPQKISYQGRLTDTSGNPLPGDHSAMFAIYDDPSYGILLWSESKTVTADADGVFSTILGSVTPLDCSFEAPRWLEVYVDGLGLMPRREIVSVAYAFVAGEAFQAGNADSLGGVAAGSYAAATHAHSTLAAQDGDPAEAVYVNVNGRVGIGTDEPTQMLHISDDVNNLTGIVISNANTSGYSSEGIVFGNEDGEIAGLRLFDDNSVYSSAMALFNNRPGGNIRLGTGSVDRVFIDQYGKVGIGVAAPVEELEVAGTIKVAADGYPLKLVGTSGGYIDFTTADQQPMGLRLQNSSRTWMLINGLGGSDLLGLYDSSGPAGYERAIVVDGPTHKIGIGTSSPTARLDVSNSTGYNQFRMRTSYTPTSTTDPNGAVGDIAWDDDYFYVKTSAGWKRGALSTFGL